MHYTFVHNAHHAITGILYVSEEHWDNPGVRALWIYIYTVKPPLKDTSEKQKPHFTGHHCSVPFDIPHIDMCIFETSEIKIPPYTGQLTVVPMVSLL